MGVHWQGKSLVLGALATLLAILGFSVDCVCYLQYLSTRDYLSFKAIFEAFRVDHWVCYGTFSSLSKRMINGRCDVREGTRSFMMPTAAASASLSPVGSICSDGSRRRILLIDEVFYSTPAHIKSCYEGDPTTRSSSCVCTVRSVQGKAGTI